uniref:Uncharacterized protein n=1 Tax=viral metagenome TaxID=1070528 RepID=A0A6H2A3K8_9ZZZZ
MGIMKAQEELEELGIERCVECNEPTGNAGKGEDSFYVPANGRGPFCEACFDKELNKLRRESQPESCMGINSWND